MKKYAFNHGLSPSWLPKKLLLVMKLIIVLMTTCLLQVSAAGFAQKLTYSKKGATLEQIFVEIRKQTGYFVVYAEDKVDREAQLDVNFRNTDLKDVLDVISKSQNLSYTFNEKNIGLKPKEEPGFLDNLVARFQQIEARGRVVDSLGNGLAGASVSVKGVKQSTQTSASGDFYLKNVEEGAVLVVSYLGYVAKEQKVEKDFNRVQLQLSTSKLDEVQIQAYGKTSRRLSTGNIVTIKADEIAKQPVNNPLLALQARVPNLVISPNSGLPGAGINLQLRGQNSLSGASLRSEPLIVIDGVPQQNNLSAGTFGSFGLNNDRMSALSFVNPKDIEQIDVLADADATAIYGSRGGNGVIIITTKKGKAGQIDIDISANQGFSEVSNKLAVLNTEQYLKIRRKAYEQDGLTVPNLTTQDKNSSNFDLTLWDQNRYTDWQEEFLGRTAPSTHANLSISGGSDILQCLISGSFSTQNYVFPGKADFTTGSGSTNFHVNSRDKRFGASLNTTYVHNNSFTPSADLTQPAISLAPNAPRPYIDGSTLNWEPNNLDPGNRPSWKNPYAQLLNTSRSTVTSIRANSELSYSFNDGLTFKVTAGMSRVQNRTMNLYPIAAQDPSIVNATGTSVRSNLWANSLTLDPQINFVKNVSSGRLDIVLGGTYQNQINNNENIRGEGFTSDALLSNIGAGNTTLSVNNSSQYKYFGIFGRVNYSMADKYIMNLSARRDGSSRFGPEALYGNFWSIGTAWIFNREKIISRNLGWLSFGKLRSSYGRIGNDGIGDYQYIELYESITNVQYQGIKGIRSLGAVDPKYHWEDVRKLEVALDLGFLHDRLLVSSSYWRTRSFDQLGGLSVPFTAGARGNRIVVNQDASIQNSGWDFVLNSTNLTGEFTWVSSFNCGWQTNKLLSKPDVASKYYGYGYNPFIEIGKPFNGFEVVYDYQGINPATGVYQFKDKLGNISSDKENSFSQAKKIDTRPLTAGISNSFSYKRINLSFFLELTRRVQRNPTLDFAFTALNPGSFDNGDVGMAFGNLPLEYLNHWKQLGDHAEVSRLSAYAFFDPLSSLIRKANVSDFNWVDASYVRLRNVSISYSLPKLFVKKLGLKDAVVSMNVQNAYTLTKYKGLDPEIGSQATLPLLRTITTGVQIKL